MAAYWLVRALSKGKTADWFKYAFFLFLNGLSALHLVLIALVNSLVCFISTCRDNFSRVGKSGA